nr:MAG TPA: hypothetical protein [Caudoviricetes sp.]
MCYNLRCEFVASTAALIIIQNRKGVKCLTSYIKRRVDNVFRLIWN